MKQLLIVLFLLGYFSSGAQASEHREDGSQTYAGISYSVVESGDIENGNLGLVLGGSVGSGLGAEIFYSNTINEDEVETTGFPDVRYSTQAWGLLGSYRFGTRLYVLLKAGYTFLDVKSKVAGGSNERFSEDGWTYGIGAGIQVGSNGAIELNYLVLPDIELSAGDQFLDVENKLISLGYNWYF